MKIALIIIGIVIGIIGAARHLNKTEERKDFFRRHTLIGCLIVLIYMILGGVAGWLFYII
jgi:hypothetical protein